MQQEYTISTAGKTIFFILGVAIFGASIFIFSLPKNPNVSAAIYVIPVMFIALGVLMFVTAIRRKVIVDESTIKSTNAFWESELPLSYIRGYRIDSKRIVLESNSGAKMIIPSYNDLKNSGELVSWIRGEFTDLNAIDIENERENLLSDSAIGATPEEREANLNRAKQTALIYNIIGGVLGAILIFHYSKLTIITAMIYPLISILLIAYGKGLIRFYVNVKRSIYPFVLIGFFVPAFVLFLKAITGRNIFSADNLWMPAIGAGIVVFALLYLTMSIKGTKPNVAETILILVFVMIYSFGSVLQVNCAFDDSELHIYGAKVYEKHISHGKSTAYYLKLSKWGPRQQVKQVGVGSNFFYRTQIGDTVKIYFKEGKLNIPWFVIGN